MSGQTLRSRSARAAEAGLGIWLMVAPSVVTFSEDAAAVARIVGPSVAALAIVALSPATRSIRWAIVPLAAAVVAAPLFVRYTPEAFVASILPAVVLLALPAVGKGDTTRLGGGWSRLWRGEEATD